MYNGRTSQRDTTEGVEMAKKKKPALNQVNEARRKAEAKALAEILRERARSNASGAHEDKRTKRLRTREAKTREALRDFDSGLFSYPAKRSV